MSIRSSAAIKSVRFQVLAVGLAGLLALLGAAAFAASAKAGLTTFASLHCGEPPGSGRLLLPTGQFATCTARVSNVGGNSPVGAVTFSDPRGAGSFSPPSCVLRVESKGASFCEVGFSSGITGERILTMNYPGDGENNAAQANLLAKVFIPNSTRFASPTGTGADPCTDRAHPCPIFTAASTLAPGTSIAPGQTVILAPGTYTNFGALNGEILQTLALESGITFRGEGGAARPLLSFQGFGLFSRNDTISHIEVSGVSGALSLSGGSADEVIARSSGANAATCNLATANSDFAGVLTDSACLSTGAGASAVEAGMYSERGETIEPRLRNVTAVSTGPQSFGLHAKLENAAAFFPHDLIDAKSVIAKGTKADVAGESVSFDGPIGTLHITLDHSNYSTIEPSTQSAGIVITVPGEALHNNITGDPLLAADNIHETFSSPTINKGVVDSISGSVDVDGEARKQDVAVDIGADEIPPPNTTDTKLSCKATAVFTGGSTRCTATVTDHADGAAARAFDGDTVTFQDTTQANVFVPSTCTLVASGPAKASCQTEVELKPTLVAEHSLKAVFATDGKGHLASEGTSSVQVKPQPNTTETKLSCKATSVFSGGSTKCSATVTDTADHQPVSSLTGAVVSFKDNTEGAAFPPFASCTLVATGSNQAACQTEVDFAPTTIASHSLEASYPGDADRHAPSVGTLALQVKPKPNTTETELSCKAGSLVSGETTKCNVVVTDSGDHQTPSALAGAVVTFKDSTEGGAFPSPATCTLVAKGAVQATCQTEVDFKPTTAATHNLEASYPGDGDKHAPSSDTLVLQVKPKLNVTETELSCKAGSLVSGETTKCSVTVTDTANNNPASPLAGAVVTFKDNTESAAFAPTASCTLAAKNSLQATCQTEVDFKPTTAATHNLEASYPGDAEKHAASSGTLPVQVKPKPNKTETELSCKAGSLVSGETTKCSVTVTDTANNNPASSMAGAVVAFRDPTESGAFTPPATCTLVMKNSLQAVCQAEVELKPTIVAIHSLEATYPGDAERHAPSLGTLNLQVRAQVQPNHTDTKLTCKSPSAISGETTKCTATVTDKADNGPPSTLAGGIVTFKDNTEPAAFPQPASCQLVTLNPTEAGCQVEVDFKPTTVANHALEATYPGATGVHVGSTGALTVPVKPQPNDTETALRCAAAPLFIGESTQCTVIVTDKANHSPAASLGGAIVNFKDNTDARALTPTSCTLAVTTTTTATCQLEVEFKPTLVANHALEATFAGDEKHSTSTGLLTVQVKPLPNNTETKLTCGASSLITGETTHCTATVTDKGDNGAPTPPTGTVTFKDNTQAGSFTPASCRLRTTGANVSSCEAEVGFAPTTIANHQLEASVPADGAHLGSSGSLAFPVKIQPNDTETELTCRVASLVTGGATTCTATVTDTANHNPASSLAGGVVTFNDNTEAGAFAPPATCTLASKSPNRAACQTEVDFRPTAVARHELEASYPGDGGAHARSVDGLSFQVNAQPNDTETELACKAASLTSGAATTCTVTVIDTGNHSAPSPLAGGTVTFKDNAQAGAFGQAATCVLVAKGATRASCQEEVELKPTTVGKHALEARYPGDGANHAESAGALDLDVKAAPTKTTLACAPAAVVLGTGASQCTVTVEDTSASPTRPSGEVKLEVLSGDGVFAAKACTLPDNGGAKVSCNVVAYTPAKAGDHALKASYQGDATHEPSIDGAKVTATAQVIAPPPPPPPAPPVAPNTTLTKKPAKKTASKQAAFGFSSDQPGSTFLCKLDRKAPKPCSSPFKVKVGKGAHTLTVQAVSAQGVADATPVVYRWTVGPVKRRPKR